MDERSGFTGQCQFCPNLGIGTTRACGNFVIVGIEAKKIMKRFNDLSAALIFPRFNISVFSDAP